MPANTGPNVSPPDPNGASVTRVAPGPREGWLSKGRLMALSAYWLATNLHWAALMLVIIPNQVEKMDPAHKAQVVSRLLSWGAIVALVMPPLVGALSDRCRSAMGRRRPFMLLGTPINILGLLLMWAAGAHSDLRFYFLGFLVVQFGNNLATAPYSGVIPDMVREGQRGSASGYMAAMSQVGTVIGAFVSGQLMGRGHIAASYTLLAVALVLGLAATVAAIREAPVEEPPEPLSLLELLKGFWIDPRQYPDFAWVWITRALVTMGIFTVQPFIRYYLSDVIRTPEPDKQVGYLLGIICIGATFAGVTAGSISDRIGRKRVVYIANSAIAIMSLGFLFVHTLPMVYLVGFLFGCGYGAYLSVDWALGCDVLPHKENAAKDMGVWHIAMVLPQSLAPAIAGSVLDRFGQTAGNHYRFDGYAALFGIAAFYLLLGAILLRNVKGVR